MSTNLNPTDSAVSEFVTEEFETAVKEGTVRTVAETIEEIVREIRSQIRSDDRLEALLRSQPGGTVLTSNDTAEHSDPEPFTQREIIEPLFRSLGYPTLSPEAGDLSAEYGQQADYAVSLSEKESIDSERLLVEAEPLNKKLDQESHGVGQVKDWLGQRRFQADFGIATDGIRWRLIKYDPDTYTFDTLSDVDLQPVFLAVFEDLTSRQDGPEAWLSESLEEQLTVFIRTFGFENFLSIAGDAPTVIRRKKEEITEEFYDDYVRLVFGIAEDEEERTARSLIGDGVIAPEEATGDDIRLFAVELMNRLVFIKFLEDKGLVNETLLRDLKDAHESGLNPETFYKTYLEPLFFGVLDERPDDRSERIRQIQLYSDVPYLNGGLFRPQVKNGGTFDDEDFDVRDSVLTSIIDLLEGYSFSADGGPTDLDPSVLGNVFEKTINYITTDPANRQKELGAYYTPDEITRFCAEQTVQPALLDRFKERMVEKWGWTEEMVEEYDDIYELIEALPDTNKDVAEDLLEVINHFRALDPACGSGHFLTSAQSEIVGIRKALYEKHDDNPANWELHKRTVIENIYGVDIVGPAVEIAKLRLWLSIIAEVDPGEVGEYDQEDLALPNVVFNIRQGNSLIGFTDLMETSGDGDQAQLTTWGADSVRKKYGDIIAQIERHKRASDTDEARAHLEEAERLLSEYRGDLDEKVLNEFHEAGIEEVSIEQIQEYRPFHWVLEFAEVYADDGFDVVVGNPPWDVLRIDREDYFTRFDPEFRTLMPEEKDDRVEQLLEDEEIAEGWEEYQQEMQMRADYFNSSGEYTLQSPSVDGRKVTTENELSALFLERVFNIAREDGRVSFILPNVIFVGSSGKDLRLQLLNNTSIDSIIHFENHGIFDELDSRYRFGILTFKNSGKTDDIHGIFSERSLDVLTDYTEKTARIPRKILENYSPKAMIFPQISISREQHDGEIDPQYPVQILDKMLQYPSLDEDLPDKWKAIPHRELDRSYDSDRFIENPEQADYPVYGGKNIYHYIYDDRFLDVAPTELWSIDEEKGADKSAKSRIREKEVRTLKTELYEAFDGTGSQKQFVNDLLNEARGSPLSEEDVLLDCTQPRIVFRDITHATNEKTFVAAVIPEGIVCHSKLRTIRPHEIDPSQEDLAEKPLHNVYSRIFDDKELFAALGLFNSIPFDHLMKTKIYTTIVAYKFKESQVPRLTEGDDWFEYIWTRAARLNCYGEAFEEMRDRLGIEPAIDEEERKELQAEIDAAAFHVYGLDRKEAEFVLTDFHRVGNPRVLTEDYFDLVLEKYDETVEVLAQFN